MKEIKERTKILAEEEKKAYLVSHGFNPDDILTDNSADSDDSDDIEVSLENLVSESDGEVYSSELEKPQKKDQDEGNGEPSLSVQTCMKDTIEHNCEEIREELEQTDSQKWSEK